MALDDPARYHGDVAAGELHWYDAADRRWLTRDPADGGWRGWSADDGAPREAPELGPGWRPWRTAFDDSQAPLYRWFAGGLTNACFNEVDRHVLAGGGEHVAFVFEGDRWDPSKDHGRGGPVHEERITYRRLLYETVRRAEILAALGVGKGRPRRLQPPQQEKVPDTS